MSLFQLFLKHQKLIYPTVLGAAILGFVLASLMPVYYKAETIIFPPNTHVSDHLISAGLRFGGDKEIDEHIQLLSSGIVRDSMINRFDLKKHYDLETNSSTFLDDLFEEYDNNVRVRRTPYNSIAVAIWDQSPEVASQMTNELVLCADRIKSRMFKANIKTAYHKNQKAYLDKKNEVDALLYTIQEIKSDNYNTALRKKEGKIKDLRAELSENQKSLEKLKNNYGVYELDSQLHELYTSYLNARHDYFVQDGLVANFKQHANVADTILIKHRLLRDEAKLRIKALRPRVDSLKEVQGAYGELLNDQANINRGLEILEDDYRLVQSSFDREFANEGLQYLKSQYNLELQFLLELKKKKDEMKAFIDAESPKSYLVSPAKLPQKKDKPKRTLISLGAAIGAFFIVMVFILIREERLSPKFPL